MPLFWQTGHVEAKCFKKQRDNKNKKVSKPSGFKAKNLFSGYNPKANDFKTVQVGCVVNDRDHECIEMKLPETIRNTVSLLLDMGADISLIKVGELEDDAEILNNTQKIIMGISEDPV